MIERLTKLLQILKLKPASGWGRTTFIWKNGEIVLIQKEEELKPEAIS